jgi:hypothetical protein
VFVAIAVEGPTDHAAIEKILSTRSLCVDPKRVYQCGGKARLDEKLTSYNAAAHRSPWLVLRDADSDGQNRAVCVRAALLPMEIQAPALCFRLAVRALEAWLLADCEAFAAFFSVSVAAVPRDPEGLIDPKTALVGLCRKSRKSDIRRAMVPPPGGIRKVGTEYTTRISEYCRGPWRPDVAAESAPSLRRTLRQIDELNR